MAFDPTHEQKREALELVHYEMEMFYETMYMRSPNRFMNSAYVESMLLHARNLIDFFQYRQRKFDDVLSFDYDFPAKQIDLNADVENRLNKDLAHITYDRLKRRNVPEKDWDLKDFTPLVDRCIEFIGSTFEAWLKANITARYNWPDLRTKLDRLSRTLKG